MYDVEVGVLQARALYSKGSQGLRVYDDVGCQQTFPPRHRADARGVQLFLIFIRSRSINQSMNPGVQLWRLRSKIARPDVSKDWTALSYKTYLVVGLESHRMSYATRRHHLSPLIVPRPERQVLEKIVELQRHEPAQFEELGLPLSIKRLAWEKSAKLFVRVVSPAAEKYVSSEFSPKMIAASQQV